MTFEVNDYPLAGCVADGGCPFPLPSWAVGFLVRECASFAAWRMHNDLLQPNFQEFYMGATWGNGGGWGAAAATAGFPVDNSPRWGDIACFPTTYGFGVSPTEGHVGICVSADAAGTHITLESYNWVPFAYAITPGIPVVGPNGVPVQFAHILAPPPPTPPCPPIGSIVKCTDTGATFQVGGDHQIHQIWSEQVFIDCGLSHTGEITFPTQAALVACYPKGADYQDCPPGIFGLPVSGGALMAAALVAGGAGLVAWERHRRGLPILPGSSNHSPWSEAPADAGGT